MAHSLPQALATPNNFLYEIQGDVEPMTVGFIWLAQVETNSIKSALNDMDVKPP